ncbi:MAG: alpha-hydroxy acid oxidase [Myxococcota bacterium]
MDELSSAINLADVEQLARGQMTATAWDYYASGAEDEITLRGNRAAFERLPLHYRVLVDVSERDLRTRILGQDVAMPVLVAPSAFHQLAHPDGELATVRAAGRAGTVMILSTMSNTPVEEVVAAASGPVWFQLYVYRDRGLTRGLVERAQAAGCSALVLTVDAPLLGRRERDVPNQFSLPEGLSIANMLPAGLDTLPDGATDSGLAAYFATLLDPSLTWSDIDWLRSITSLPIAIKGIVRGDDAARAVAHGAEAIIVSNHGGRQLDTAPATIDVLGAVVASAGADAEIMLDGGVRRGTDVVKALALGARAVLLGRPALWGLATAGEAGVVHVLDLLRGEFDLAMGLCGCPSVADIGPDLITPG